MGRECLKRAVGLPKASRRQESVATLKFVWTASAGDFRRMAPNTRGRTDMMFSVWPR